MKTRTFIQDDFLLEDRHAERLYHDYAETLPIIDYHCHLPAAQIAEDIKWDNLAQVWLYGDHYKWRAMRANGVAEQYISGDASDREKFEMWAATVPSLLKNPLYHWTHLELARYFDITDRLLCPDTAQGIWDECNEKLAGPEFSCRNLVRRSNVALVCTTDDPVDSLEHHSALAADGSFSVPVLPAWRPDKGMAVDDVDAFNLWVNRLGESADVEIRSLPDYMEALGRRHLFFHDMGCRLSDHGLETIDADPYEPAQVEAAFAKIRGGTAPEPDEAATFRSAMLYEFAVMDHSRDWTQQYHLGALRNNSSRMFRLLGPDSGFDSIGDLEIARPLSRLLDRLDEGGNLARTIVYNLNPRDNEMIATMLANFQDESVPGKMQFGSAWWFLDHKDGMERQIEVLSHSGLLARFVGMLTDSRSFLSYTRHEYFRRILCNVLGNDMARGLVPDDMDLVGGMVRDICYGNAAAYFGFDLPESA